MGTSNLFVLFNYPYLCIKHEALKNTNRFCAQERMNDRIYFLLYKVCKDSFFFILSIVLSNINEKRNEIMNVYLKLKHHFILI